MAVCEKCGREIPADMTLCETCAEETIALPETADEILEEVAAEAAAETVEETAEESVPQPPRFEPDFQAVPAVQPYTPPVRPSYALPLTGESVPAEYKPLGAWAYFLYSLLFSLPLIGFVCLIVFACGGTKNVNLRNYARSYFCGLLVAVVLAAIVVGLALALGVGSSITDNVREILPY